MKFLSKTRIGSAVLSAAVVLSCLGALPAAATEEEMYDEEAMHDAAEDGQDVQTYAADTYIEGLRVEATNESVWDKQDESFSLSLSYEMKSVEDEYAFPTSAGEEVEFTVKNVTGWSAQAGLDYYTSVDGNTDDGDAGNTDTGGGDGTDDTDAGDADAGSGDDADGTDGVDGEPSPDTLPDEGYWDEVTFYCTPQGTGVYTFNVTNADGHTYAYKVYSDVGEDVFLRSAPVTYDYIDIALPEQFTTKTIVPGEWLTTDRYEEAEDAETLWLAAVFSDGSGATASIDLAGGTGKEYSTGDLFGRSDITSLRFSIGADAGSYDPIAGVSITGTKSYKGDTLALTGTMNLAEDTDENVFASCAAQALPKNTTLYKDSDGALASKNVSASSDYSDSYTRTVYKDYFFAGNMQLDASKTSVDYRDSYTITVSGMEAWGKNSRFSDTEAVIDLGGAYVTGISLPAISADTEVTATLTNGSDYPIKDGSEVNDRFVDKITVKITGIKSGSFTACNSDGCCKTGTDMSNYIYHTASGNSTRLRQQHPDKAYGVFTLNGFAQSKDLVIYAENRSGSGSLISAEASLPVKYQSADGETRTETLSSGASVFMAEGSDGTEDSGSGDASGSASVPETEGSGSGQGSTTSSGDTGGGYDDTYDAGGASGEASDEAADEPEDGAADSEDADEETALLTETESGVIDLSGLNLTATKGTAVGGQSIMATVVDTDADATAALQTAMTGGSGTYTGITYTGSSSVELSDGTIITNEGEVILDDGTVLTDEEAEEFIENLGDEDMILLDGLGLPADDAADGIYENGGLNASRYGAIDPGAQQEASKTPFYKSIRFWLLVAVIVVVVIIIAAIARRRRKKKALEDRINSIGSDHYDNGYAGGPEDGTPQ